MTPGQRDLPTVLLSVETATRELDSKLALAAALAESGCRAIVGHKEAAKEIARRSRRVVWLGKSVFSRDAAKESLVAEFARNESTLMFHHDEGGIYPERDWSTLMLRSHPPELFSQDVHARVCTWGARQTRLLAERLPGLERSVANTGSSRFDVCAPEYAWIENASDPVPRERHAPYILVNTRFASVAHFRGMRDTFVNVMSPAEWPAWVSEDAIRDLWFSTWYQDARDLADMMILTKELARANPGHTIVLRPHPSEDIELYRAAFASFRNVVVTREGSVIYWIRAAALVVHCKCTTGIEAVMAGRPVLHFWPDRERDATLGEAVAREAGVTVGTVREALETAADLLRGTTIPQVWSEAARETLSNLTSPAIPRLVAETHAVLRERNISSSDVRLPRAPRRFRPIGFIRNRLRPRAPDYVQSKRGRIDPQRVHALIEGGRAMYPRATIRSVTGQYVVIEPA